jgi:hypothetical protein
MTAARIARGKAPRLTPATIPLALLRLTPGS